MTDDEREVRRKSRSAVTSGRKLLIGGDPNSAWSRRYRDLVVGHCNDLGGRDLLSEAQHSLIRRAAALAVELEQMEAPNVAWRRGRPRLLWPGCFAPAPDFSVASKPRARLLSRIRLSAQAAGRGQGACGRHTTSPALPCLDQIWRPAVATSREGQPPAKDIRPGLGQGDYRT
jgi:hypothetical protein